MTAAIIAKPGVDGASTVGVLGLGIMGSAISANLVAAGFEVIGFDPSSALFLHHFKLARRTVARLRNDRQSH